MSQLSIEDLTRVFIHLRDKKKEMEARHKEELAPINAKMDRALSLLDAYMTSQGLQNAKNAYGTPYKVTVDTVRITDWESAVEFVEANHLQHWYTRALSKEGVVTYLEEHGALPPGVELVRRTKVNVKR